MVEKHGWAEGKVFAYAVGLKAGPRTLMLFGEGTTAKIDISGPEPVLVVKSPNEEAPGGFNVNCFPYSNVAHYGGHFFLCDKPVGG